MNPGSTGQIARHRDGEDALLAGNYELAARSNEAASHAGQSREHAAYRSSRSGDGLFQILVLDAQKQLLDSAVVAYQESLKLPQVRHDTGRASLSASLSLEGSPSSQPSNGVMKERQMLQAKNSAGTESVPIHSASLRSTSKRLAPSPMRWSMTPFFRSAALSASLNWR